MKKKTTNEKETFATFGKRRMFINVFCSIILLITNTGLSFFLSPLIVGKIGVEANGFVTLANNFVTYANIVVAALNGMAARFITVAYTQKDYEKANMYYNSVFWGNLIIVGLLFLPSVAILVWLQNVIEIPTNLVADVKILFAIVFGTFFLQTGLPNWDVGTYVTNRMDRSYIPNVISQITRCIIVFSMLMLLTPHVWYVALGSMISAVLLLAVKAFNTHQLTPELRIGFGKKLQCSWSAIKELVGSGLWNSVSSLGIMLLSGLSLLISNKMLGATAMGVLSLAQTLPHLVQQLANSVVSAFDPQIVIDYSLNDKERILADIKTGTKISTVLLAIPVAGIVILGKPFYELWVPSQDAKTLWILTILSIGSYSITGGSQVVYSVFTAANKVRSNAIALLISGVMSFGLSVLLVKFTDLGLFAIAGSSTLINIMRALCFALIAPAKYLDCKWWIFLPQALVCFLFTIAVSGLGYLAVFKIPQNSWLMFFVCVAIVALIGGLIAWFIVLRKPERNYVLRKLHLKK